MSRLYCVGRAEGAALFVHLDYSAGVVQHADNCSLRPGVGAILRVRDRVTDRVGRPFRNWSGVKRPAAEVFCHSERSEESLIVCCANLLRANAEMFESLASCFAFRCSASLNMTNELSANRGVAGKALCRPCRSPRSWSTNNPRPIRRHWIPPPISRVECRLIRAPRPLRHLPV